jgi:hypothetical protein
MKHRYAAHEYLNERVEPMLREELVREVDVDVQPTAHEQSHPRRRDVPNAAVRIVPQGERVTDLFAHPFGQLEQIQKLTDELVLLLRTVPLNSAPGVEENVRALA